MAYVPDERDHASLGRWPGDPTFIIRMPQQFRRNRGAGKGDKHDLQPANAGVLHGQYAIRIPRDQHHAVYRARADMVRYIQTDAHVHALLLEVGLEIGVGQLRLCDGNLLWLESPELQYPQPNRKQVLCRKRAQPRVRAVELLILSRNRKLDPAGIGSAIVIQDPQQRLAIFDRRVTDFLYVVRIILISRLPREDTRMPPVNQNGHPQHTEPPRVAAQGSQIDARLRAYRIWA